MALKTGKNDVNLMYCRASPCASCGRRPPSTPHHLHTRGAGGQDDHWNLLPLCLDCHRKIHAMGTYTFATRYDLLKELEMRGWEFDQNNKLRRK